MVMQRAKDEVHRGKQSELGDRLESLLVEYTARTPPRADSTDSRGYITRILVRDGGTVTFQPVDGIDWIEAADYYAKLHVGEAVQLVRYTMNELESQLDPRRFVRIHRSAIVNAARVKEIRVDYQNHHVVVLHNGKRVPLSRRRRDLLEAVMQGS
jgi:two-component system LytT family response regulator